jgi:hypothetical protein
MIRSALLGFVMLASSSPAISAQEEFDCANAYKSALDALKRRQVPPEQLAALRRRALRIYDACETKDLKDAKALFESLERWKD